MKLLREKGLIYEGQAARNPYLNRIEGNFIVVFSTGSEIVLFDSLD